MKRRSLANPVVTLAAALVAALAVALPAGARAADETACAPGLALAEREARLPPRVLPTLALVESGRARDGRVAPWPWTINVEGVGHFYESKADAIAAVRAFQAAGARSIDVGCMQISLLMHPGAFATLDDAFDPVANTRYGARFLRALYAASGRWGVAMTAYHSSTPVLAADYARKVLDVWPGAAALGLAAPEPGPDGPGPNGADPDAGAHHDYTAAFARQVAADMADRRALLARMGAPALASTRAPAPARSLLHVASAAQRHGPAWPGGTP